ncbi:ankyrin repeat domain-containing protein [Luteimonas sp. XNQY3]|nr:ankyrin repeat domain-containing protein [Luteimonas sp. XNQY3]MCD9007560.1 ankyrin repeat domain-containing protein [Luteimonas sp. XNQY3]
MSSWPKRESRTGLDEYGRTQLWYRAAAGEISEVKTELSSGGDPSAGDDAGYTPLHVAVQNGHLKVVEALLSAGANPNATDKHGNGPLWTAVLTTRIEKSAIIEALLDAGASADHVNMHGRSPAAVAQTIGGDLVEVFSHVRNDA